jgi:uncharacterized LabA/DUF88 family protein
VTTGAASRVAVFIDGSNLYHRLHDCGWSTRVDVQGFAGRLAGARQVVAVFYYNVPPPSTARPQQKADQQRYYAQVQASSGVTFRLGFLQTRQVGGVVLHEEKGVDVELVVDMLTAAFEDRYDTAILVSSDGDFKPAVQAVQRFGKRVEYIYFKNSTFSRALDSVCDVSRECRRSWVVLF